MICKGTKLSYLTQPVPKQVVGWIWPVGHSLPAPDLSVFTNVNLTICFVQHREAKQLVYSNTAANLATLKPEARHLYSQFGSGTKEKSLNPPVFSLKVVPCWVTSLKVTVVTGKGTEVSPGFPSWRRDWQRIRHSALEERSSMHSSSDCCSSQTNQARQRTVSFIHSSPPSLEHTLLFYTMTCQMLKRHILKNNKCYSVSFWWPGHLVFTVWSWGGLETPSHILAFFSQVRACTHGVFYMLALATGPWAGDPKGAHWRVRASLPQPGHWLFEPGFEHSLTSALIDLCQGTGQAELMCGKRNSPGLFSTAVFQELQTESKCEWLGKCYFPISSMNLVNCNFQIRGTTGSIQPTLRECVNKEEEGQVDGSRL